MEQLYYSIDGRLLTVCYPDDEKGRCMIYWEDSLIGYLYVSDLCINTCTPIWVASSDYVELFKEELSNFIESSNL